jgi:hypothetical protein
MDYSKAIWPAGVVVSLVVLAGYSYSLDIMRKRLNEQLDPEEQIPFVPKVDDWQLISGVGWMEHRRRICERYQQAFPGTYLPTMHRRLLVAYFGVYVITLVAIIWSDFR